MSRPAKPKRPRKPGKRIDRPFDPEILARARRTASDYQVILRFEREDGCWFGRGLELPNAHEDGETPDECVKKMREMLVTVVAYMLEEGQVPPLPANDALRNQQVNIRLTTEEKLRLEESAHQAGFRGISDFMRAKALA